MKELQQLGELEGVLANRSRLMFDSVSWSTSFFKAVREVEKLVKNQKMRRV